jgi:CRISPR-associated endonuclease/helicase Cas3
MNYQEFFHSLTEHQPYPWQSRFAEWNGEQIAVVNLPTGTGKEFGATIPWLYGHYQELKVPNRLIYCLPTRSLVDQVYNNIYALVDKAGLSINVYCLKGGKLEQGYEDHLTKPAVLVGTQDQLLSRALNRGYAVSWTQRPKHAAAVNNDCRWVLDETQLMGVGYPTGVKLHQLRQQLGCIGRAELVLMSATQNLTPLKQYPYYVPYELHQNDYDHPYLGQKLKKSKPVEKKEISSIEDIAKLAETQHQSGQLTLVVLNTVKRAREVGEQLEQLTDEVPILIVHSRFLGFDRNRLQKKLYEFQGIVVATQVVEAGVDLDASTLITELCPWSSFVQRVGRCGRTKVEQPAQVCWLDWQKDWSADPYKLEECDETKQQLASLSDVGLESLLEVNSSDSDLPEPTLEEKEIQQFFNTHERKHSATEYVRDISSYTARVFWADNLPKTIPHQSCLCPVPVYELNNFLNKQGISPYVWNDENWEQKTKVEVGDVVNLSYLDGGYSHESGWTGKQNHFPLPYSLTFSRSYNNDPPFPHWVSLKTHAWDVAFEMKQYAPTLRKLDISEDEINLLIQCARWHDWGKAHRMWQEYANAQEEFVAKSPKYKHFSFLKGYRHELASAIATARQGAPFLAQYLIAAHHGKVRESLRSPNGEFNPQILRGVKLGTDQLPQVQLGEETLSEVTLNYPEATSWRKNVYRLLKQYGAFQLFYLETLIRNADVEASKNREKEAKDDN